MNGKGRFLVVCFVLLVLLSTLGSACGKTDQGDTRIITIGVLTDIAGPAGSCCIPLTYGVMDLVKYINETDPIPGVEIELATYDTMYNPARDMAGYEWVKERGAELIIAVLPTTSEALKPFAEKDRIPMFAMSTTPAVLDPPGWVFTFEDNAHKYTKALLKWIADQWPNYPTRPKIGSAGWNEPFHIEVTEAVKEYCLDYPAEFEYLGGYLAPMGTVTWPAEVERLKDCDYVAVPSTGLGTATFIEEYRNREYTARFIGTDGLAAFRSLLMDKCGWQKLDGTWNTLEALWWTEPYPIVELGKQLLYKNHPKEAEDIIYAGSGYITGGIQEAYVIFEILRETVLQVGADNFDGQAYYDTAIEFQTTWEGYPQMGYSQEKRNFLDYTRVYEWKAEADDLVSVTGWLPFIE